MARQSLLLGLIITVLVVIMMASGQMVKFWPLGFMFIVFTVFGIILPLFIIIRNRKMKNFAVEIIIQKINFIKTFLSFLGFGLKASFIR